VNCVDALPPDRRAIAEMAAFMTYVLAIREPVQ